MTIQELGALGEFVGSVLVLGTLAYLVIQLRYTQRAMMSQMHQMRADGLKETWQTFAMSSELRQTYAELAEAGWKQGGSIHGAKKALGQLTPDQQQQVTFWEVGLYIYGENSFYHHKQGFYDDEFFEYNLEPYIGSRSSLWLALGLHDVMGRPGWVELVEKEASVSDA